MQPDVMVAARNRKTARYCPIESRRHLPQWRRSSRHIRLLGPLCVPCSINKHNVVSVRIIRRAAAPSQLCVTQGRHCSRSLRGGCSSWQSGSPLKALRLPERRQRESRVRFGRGSSAPHSVTRQRDQGQGSALRGTPWSSSNGVQTAGKRRLQESSELRSVIVVNVFWIPCKDQLEQALVPSPVARTARGQDGSSPGQHQAHGFNGRGIGTRRSSS